MTYLNKTYIHHRLLSDLLKINYDEDFHDYIIEHAIRCYQKKVGEENLGSVLAVCANEREVKCFKKFPFSKIVITGIINQEEQIKKAADGDKRIHYEKQQCEKLTYKNQSFDLVFCKEGLHHLPRPVLGLYEMLRVCKKAAIVIEPYDTLLGQIFERLGLSSTYETDQEGNLKQRSNFVYRWSKRQLNQILNSYYLESGYVLDLYLGWLSIRYGSKMSGLAKKVSIFLGWLAGFIPDSNGNYMTAVIYPGKDIPPEI